MYLWRIHISVKNPKTVRQNELDMSFSAKEKWHGPGTSKRNKAIHREMNSVTGSEQRFAGTIRNNGTQRGLGSQRPC